MLRWNDSRRRLELGVRDLFERRGRGEGGLGVSSPRVSRRGARLHQRLQGAMEGEGYAAEVGVEWEIEIEGWTCVLRGRVDGVTDLGEHTLVEELKSTAVPEAGLDALVEGLRPRAGEPVERRHPWVLQLGLYVLVVEAAGRPGVRGVLRVVSLVDAGQRTLALEPEPAVEAAARARLRRLVDEREDWLAWQAERRRRPIPFPHLAARPGQEEVSEAVEAAVREGGHLLLSAPTGFGKTAAVLTGALRGALDTGRPIFVATARTTQQRMPAETLAQIAALGAPLRVVTLRAREKVCRGGATAGGAHASPEAPCRPDLCPLREGHDERPHRTSALRELRALVQPSAATLDGVAARHGLCPYELALDHARGCDVVIGDYNLYFHPRGRLARLFDERDWVVLVDEAHQLPERVMDARSPAVHTAGCDATREWAEHVGAAPLLRWAEAVREEIADSRLRWVAVVGGGGGGDGEAFAGEEAAPGATSPTVYVVEPNPRRWRDLAERAEELLFDPGLHTLIAASEGRAGRAEDGGAARPGPLGGGADGGVREGDGGNPGAAQSEDAGRWGSTRRGAEGGRDAVLGPDAGAHDRIFGRSPVGQDGAFGGGEPPGQGPESDPARRGDPGDDDPDLGLWAAHREGHPERGDTAGVLPWRGPPAAQPPLGVTARASAPPASASAPAGDGGPSAAAFGELPTVRAVSRVLELLRAVLDFADALESAGDETVVFWEGVEGPRGDVAARLRLFCRDPSSHLGPLFGATAAAVLMTATPRPTWFLRDRCGLDPGRFREHEAPDPFPGEHRKVLIVTGLSTAWRDRDRHRERIRAQLAAVIAAVPGKIALFFSSYQQLDELVPTDALSGHLLLRQAREADDEARAHLLRRLQHEPGPVALAAVLGGSFAEGVDLPGGVLSGVVVVGPALPPPGPERRLLADWYEREYDAGHELAFIQPGMTRVVQAAGRAVRRPEDHAVIVLLCQRFARNEFRAYLPESWEVERTSRPERPIRAFFAGSTPSLLGELDVGPARARSAASAGTVPANRLGLAPAPPRRRSGRGGDAASSPAPTPREEAEEPPLEGQAGRGLDGPEGAGGRIDLGDGSRLEPER